jgi:hypothetical protein
MEVIALTAATAGQPVRDAVLTHDGRAYVVIHQSIGSMTVESRLREDRGDEREVLWPYLAKSEVNASSCATWESGEGLDQQGAAFRITQTDGVVRAVTVTRNVYGHVFYDFNFHTWNTSTSGIFSLFGQTDLKGYLGTGPARYPLNFCARTTGNVIQFVVWRPGTVKPAWGSTTQGGSALIPAGAAPESGLTGWYVGHIVPGTIASLSGMTVDGRASG